MRSERRRAAARGFTLLELVLVLTVLVILAGLIVGKLDVFELRANKGVAASNISGVSRFVQMYYVANNQYPDGVDSLIDRTGAASGASGPVLWRGPAVGQPGLIPSLVGGPLAGAPQKFATTTIASDSELYSLTRQGITTVHDLNPSSSAIPGDRFTIAKTLATGDVVATINSADSNGRTILTTLYPQVVPNADFTNFPKVVCFGIGPRCDLIGNKGLLTDPPFYSNTPDRTLYYDRYIAIFEVSASGGRSRFVGAVAADGDTLGQEINDFYKIQ